MSTEIITREETSVGDSISGRYCDGCPRCTDADAGFCKQVHMNRNHPPFTQGLHPVCRRCGHCVLRGTHNDPTDDLKE